MVAPHTEYLMFGHGCGSRVILILKAGMNDESSQLLSCVEYFCEGYESLTEDILNVEPGISNSTTTDEGESNVECFSRL